MDTEKIAKNIKKIRELRNFDQSYMAEQLEVSQTHYSRMEKGEKDIGIRQLKKIAKLLQVEWSVLEKFDVEECLSVFQQNKTTSTDNMHSASNGIDKKNLGYILHLENPEKSASKESIIQHYGFSL